MTTDALQQLSGPAIVAYAAEWAVRFGATGDGYEDGVRLRAELDRRAGMRRRSDRPQFAAPAAPAAPTTNPTTNHTTEAR